MFHTQAVEKEQKDTENSFLGSHFLEDGHWERGH